MSTGVTGTLPWSSHPTEYSVQAYATGTTSLTANTYVTVAYAAENWDTDTMHDNVTNNSRITFTTAGKYVVIANSATTSPVVFGNRIRLNGSTILGRQMQGNSNQGEGTSCVVV